MPEGTFVRVSAPGKVNLALRVGGRRPDGYHELSTVFCALSLHDEVTARLADTVSCVVGGAEAHRVGPEGDNLAYRAAVLLRDRYGVRDGVELVVDKRIPVAGGMAGGSADAAGALVACAALWGLRLSRDELLGLGAELGADVPFALQGGCALGTGRGHEVTPVLVRGTYHWVLAFAAGGLATPAVFREYDRWQATLAPPERAPERPPLPNDVLRALATGDPSALGTALVNDLHTPAVRLKPGLTATIAAGRAAGALGAVISGSGPTVAFLVADAAAATELAVAVSAQGVAAGVRVATGPVPGATLLS